MIFIIANLNTKYKSLCFGIMKNNYIEELIISDNFYFYLILRLINFKLQTKQNKLSNLNTSAYFYHRELIFKYA